MAQNAQRRVVDTNPSLKVLCNQPSQQGFHLVDLLTEAQARRGGLTAHQANQM